MPVIYLFGLSFVCPKATAFELFGEFFHIGCLLDQFAAELS
jgi:hypothetical protein